MKKTFCDRCGREVRNFEVQVEVKIGEVHYERHDICKMCMEKFIDALGNYFDAGMSDKKKNGWREIEEG